MFCYMTTYLLLQAADDAAEAVSAFCSQLTAELNLAYYLHSQAIECLPSLMHLLTMLGGSFATHKHEYHCK